MCIICAGIIYCMKKLLILCRQKDIFLYNISFYEATNVPIDFKFLEVSKCTTRMFGPQMIQISPFCKLLGQ